MPGETACERGTCHRKASGSQSEEANLCEASLALVVDSDEEISEKKQEQKENRSIYVKVHGLGDIIRSKSARHCALALRSMEAAISAVSLKAVIFEASTLLPAKYPLMTCNTNNTLSFWTHSLQTEGSFSPTLCGIKTHP